MKRLTLIVVYLSLVLAPVALSWIFGGPARPFWAELGSVLGMLSFSIILAEFLLSGRFKALSRHVGMDVTMRFHRVMGCVALAAALLHPFLFSSTPSGGARPWDPTHQLGVTSDFTEIATGIVAFLLLPALVVLAVWRSDLDYKYEVWRRLHGILAILIVLFLLHHTLFAGRYGSQTPVSILWLGLSAFALVSLLYSYFIVPLWRRKQAWSVSSITRLSPHQWGIRLTPQGHAGLEYQAGQFAWLNIGHSSYSLYENPFSIASAPAAGPDISFVIKELGDFTGSLAEIKPGTRAYIDGPYGSLNVDDRDEPGIALIAGGVGIAPMLGLLRQLKLSKDTRAVKLIYGNRSPSQIVYREELDAVGAVYVVCEPDDNWQGKVGFVDEPLLESEFTAEALSSWVFVMCGPSVMMDFVESYLISRGVDSSRILSERFDYD